jgi:hypothetical protein
MTNTIKHRLTHQMTNTIIDFIPHEDGTVGVCTATENGNVSSEIMPKYDARKLYATWRYLGAYKDTEFKKIGHNLYKVQENGTLSISYVEDWYSERDWNKALIPEGYKVDRLEWLDKDDTYSHHENPVRMWLAPIKVSE